MRGIHEQLFKTSGADVLSSGKKFRKTSEGGDNHPSPPPSPLYVRELRTKRTIGDGEFMIAAPMLWHSMPLSIRPAATIDSLKRSLKTCFLIQLIYYLLIVLLLLPLLLLLLLLRLIVHSFYYSITPFHTRDGLSVG